MRRRLVIGLIVVVLGYPLLLILLGWALTGTVEDRVRARLAYTFQADEIEIDEIDLSVLRGSLRIRGIHAQRTGIGTASLEIALLEAELPAGGLVLFLDDPDKLLISGAHLTLSAIGAATLRHEENKELKVPEFILKDSSVTLVPVSIFPGLGKTTLNITSAHIYDLSMENTISWLFQTDQLDASITAPGDVDFGLRYGDGSISVSGGMLGSVPITVPFAWPVPDLDAMELRQLMTVATSIAEALAPEIAKRKVGEIWEEVGEVLDL